MEPERRSLLRSKRKPLSDCTNILPTGRKNPSLSSSSKALKPQSVIKSAKPSHFNADANNNKLNFLTSSSPKSHTSTGSNNSPNSPSIPSIPRSPEPPAPPTPLSDAGGIDCKKARLSANQSQRHEASHATRKDKGKMVAETPIIHLSASLTSTPLEILSSSALGHCSRSVSQALQSQNLHTQTVEDKGKTTSDASWVSKYLHKSPSFSSGSFSETPAVHSQKLHEDIRKDKGKMVLETPNFEASEPSTPHAPLVPLTTSGTGEKPLTLYKQRKTQQGNKNAAGKINLLFSCPPPDQRIKKKGLGLPRGKNKSGSHTDPIPVHKKKRSHDKYGRGAMHIMPQEEVEKLRAYYADLDSFELPEEVASESEVE